MLRCKDCRKQFSFKVGTIFEDSPLGLDKWFVAVWCIANAKNGVSSHELGRAIGVTQKTAWFMLHRIRETMQADEGRKLTGTGARVIHLALSSAAISAATMARVSQEARSQEQVNKLLEKIKGITSSERDED